MQQTSGVALMSQWYLEGMYIIQQLNDICRKHDLTYDQYLVLEQIVEEKRNTPKQIADTFKTSAPASSRKINILQRKRFIEKIHNIDGDQRTVELDLTASGRQHYEAAKKELAVKNSQFKAADIKQLAAIKEK
ncbi:MarR family transcriptional regulator [Lactobacillus curvatus]|uniref:MarR family transcriptional regulator n=1 Tax=Latilactobacillus fragifolii TaxID=2814244 RepID=UPI0012B02509|nr:MarR family transcriptional regulator [Latilactobacillus fragifolii]MSD84526.1 MarR family transcriptional regulator [Latilactobacillus curvatus]MSE24541.1 MarR family transcriptional regulator [Latilactobacillus curvatus]